MNAISKPRVLRGVQPKEASPSKPKIGVFGRPGAGKSYGAVSFPTCYFIDSEGGANFPQYTDRLTAAGGLYMGPEHGASDFDTVIEEVKTLATVQHHYKTLIIDSVSHLYNTAILHEQIKLGDKDAYGASKKPAVQKLRNLLDWCQRLDMSVIFVCQEKDVWGANGKEGVTMDVDAKLEYVLHLVLNIIHQGPKRIAKIGKSRLVSFPNAETFEWNYENFAERYGRAIMEAEAKPLVLASPDQVAEVVLLIDKVKLPEDFVEKCLTKAKASNWSEMDADKIAKVIESLKEKLTA